MTNHANKQGDGPACECGGGSCCSGPVKWVWIVLALAILGVVIAKNARRQAADASTTHDRPAAVQASDAKAGVPESPALGKPLPRLVDLGAGTCIPCKMMAPILEELKTNYAGRLDVQFIDVSVNPDAGKQYGIKLIPTQIFYDAAGKELFRHEGFFDKGDILDKWKELGVDLVAK